MIIKIIPMARALQSIIRLGLSKDQDDEYD